MQANVRTTVFHQPKVHASAKIIEKIGVVQAQQPCPVILFVVLFCSVVFSIYTSSSCGSAVVLVVVVLVAVMPVVVVPVPDRTRALFCACFDFTIRNLPFNVTVHRRPKFSDLLPN